MSHQSEVCENNLLGRFSVKMEDSIEDGGSRTKLEQSEASKNKISRQILAGFSANLTMLSNGMAFSWTAPALLSLTKESSELYLTSDEASWIASALMIGACFGPIVSALLINVVGRKWFLYSTGVPFIVCWAMTYTAQSFVMLFAGRFICGLGTGAVFSALPMYLAEIAETKIRGALGTMSYLLLSFGMLMTYCIGPFISWKILAAISSIPTVLFLLIFPWMPESPYFLVKTNSLEKAEKSLSWLRGTESVSEELKEIADFLATEKQQRGRIYELITIPTNRRGLIIVLILLAGQQASGFAAFSSYVGLIFENASAKIDGSIAVIITGAIAFLANIVATCIVDRLGRKPLMLTSSIGSAACLFTIGIYFHLMSAKVDISSIFWLPIVTIICFYVFFSLGIGPIPYTVLAEIMPTSIKAWAATVASIYGSILGTIVSKIYQITIDTWGQHAIFYVFGICEVITVIFVIFLLPETKGKSLAEIQVLMKGDAAKSETKVR